MKPIDFLKTIYLGDRYCWKLVANSVKKEVEIYINLISRVRDESGEWNYYSDEDIENGAIVFANVNQLFLDKSGLMPNDEIYNIKAIETTNGLYEFTIEASNVNKDVETTDLIIQIIAESVYLLDPLNPDVKIVN